MTMLNLPSATWIASALFPETVTEDRLGPTLDAIAGDGRLVMVASLGTLSGTSATVRLTMQESVAGVDWDDIPESVIGPMTTSDEVFVRTFERRGRLLRLRVNLTGDEASVVLSVVVAQIRKLT